MCSVVDIGLLLPVIDLFAALVLVGIWYGLLC